MTKTETTQKTELTFYQKLANIQKELKAPKNIRNEFARFNYRNAEGILQAVKPLLGDLILTISDRIELVGDRYYIVSTAKVSDGITSETAEGRAREAEIQKGMVEAQITGSTSSYARKYALNGLFALNDSTDDPDSKDNSQHGAAKLPQVNVPISRTPIQEPIVESEKTFTESEWKDAIAECDNVVEMWRDATDEIQVQFVVDFLNKAQTANQANDMWNSISHTQQKALGKFFSDKKAELKLQTVNK